MIVIQLAIISSLLAYIVYLSHSTPPGMQQSIEAMDNLTKSEKQYAKIVQNFTESAIEAENFLSNYQKWFNVSQFFKDYLADTKHCPLCK